MTDVALAGPSLRKFRSASTEAPAACAPADRRGGRVPVLLPAAATGDRLLRGLQEGLPTFIEGITEKDALAAIKLTLIGGDPVPANLVFGLAASWAIAKFEFRGKAC